jgi:hypothetical protein
MGEGDKRHKAGESAPTSEELDGAEPADGRAPPDAPRHAVPAAERDAPRVARTTTLDDPLTTSLLAEVARRSRTIDVSPEQITEAMDLEPGDRAAAAPPGSPRNAPPGGPTPPGQASTAASDDPDDP